MYVIRIVSLLLILIGFIIFIINFILHTNNNKPIKKNNKHNFCILIPARYESNVIEDLLISIKKQSFKIDMKDVYVIVESKKDLTVKICKKYSVSVIFRKNVKLQRKGYALDDAIKQILSNSKRYDAYFIFDADNILDKDYIKNMVPVFDQGYDISSGYRNCKNGNDSAIAASSILTFSLINTIFNKRKNKDTRNITFSGTGFYIRGYLIEEWKGYPFHSLTEDYELSVFATLNNLTTYYNEKSVFYDEQPVKFKETVNQRIRWIRGYFDVRMKYFNSLHKFINFKDKNKGSKLDESIGLLPYIFIILGLIIYIISLLVFAIINISFNKYIYEFLIILCLIYMIFIILTIIILYLEGNKLNINFKTKLKVLIVNPIYIISYLYCAIIAITKKNVTWKRIEHKNRKS